MWRRYTRRPPRKKGKHGGKRVGAGRGTLSKRDRFLIGAYAETIYRADRTPLPHPDLDHADEADIESARALLRGPDDDQARKYLRSALDGRRVRKAVRPSLDEVCDKVAAEATKALKLDKPITARQVRRWRQEYLDTKKK